MELVATRRSSRISQIKEDQKKKEASVSTIHLEKIYKYSIGVFKKSNRGRKKKIYIKKCMKYSIGIFKKSIQKEYSTGVFHRSIR